MSKKIICILRISSDRQDISSQKAEMVEYIKALQYKENEIVYVTGEGASAIKLNDKYIQMLAEVKQHIQNGIKAVAVWHLNRIGRNDTILTEFKNFLIEHKVQLYCKEPSLKLLNDDGTVNTGAELAYGLFAVMVKQDMMEKMAKFKRSKRYKMKNGIYVGCNIKFGYYIDKNKEVKIKEDDAVIVKLLYELYSTGQYSYQQLRDEIKDRGYQNRKNFKVGIVQIGKILKDKNYIGIRESGYLTYPPIISEELFNACKRIRETNNTGIDKSKRYCLGIKVLKCRECGGNFIADGDYYICYYNRKGKIENVTRECKSNASITIDIMDSILWHYAANIHMEYLLNLNEDNINGYKDELKVIEVKLAEVGKQIDKINNRKDRVLASYFNGEINDDVKDNWISKINKETLEYKQKQATYLDNKSKLEKLITKTKHDIDAIISSEVDIRLNTMELQDRKEMYDIVHQHIKTASFEKSNVTIEGKNYVATKIYVEPYNKDVEILYFLYRKQKGCRLYNAKLKKVTIDRVQPNGGIYLDRVVTL